VFLREVAAGLPAKSLVYLDTPYYVKGQEMLYANDSGPEDHAAIASIVRELRVPWVVSYDNQPDVRALYATCQTLPYDIAYSASIRYRGREVAFFSPDLAIPDVPDPTWLSATALASYRFSEA
jgi:DNA adenine methylase